MNKEDAQLLSFQVISHSGDALAYFNEAIQYAREKDYEKSKEKFKEGQKSLDLAHKVQTDMIFAEANGENLDFSIILIHAQDHLMTTMMYRNLATEMISLYELVNTKLDSFKA